MAIITGSNIASLQAQRGLGRSTDRLIRTTERLASGSRINHAADDAAGLSIALSLNNDKRVYTRGIQNVNDGLSALSIAEGAISELTGVVTRIRELATQAANGTYGAKQRKALDQEAQALSKEYTRIVQSTKFNDMALLNGSMSQLNLQCGYGTNQMIAASVGGAIGTGTFGTAVSTQTEQYYSWGLALGDVNGDGIVDMVTTGYGGGGYSTVQIGRGDGTFGNRVTYVAESTMSYGVALGDINNDGILDMVSAGRNGGIGAASIRLGRGDGTFGTQTLYTMDGTFSYAVALGDMNGDGKIDLVTAGNGASGSTTIRLGRGDGTFGAATSFSTEGSYSYGLTLGDLNSDGNLDIVTAGNGGSGGSVLLGVGDGTVRSRIGFTTESGLGSVDLALGDVNGDGLLDVVSTGYTENTVNLGRGDGTFSSTSSFSTGISTTWATTLADVNGDGILDLFDAGVDAGAGRVNVRLGIGNGTFSNATSYASEGSHSFAVQLGDLNSDGVNDLVTAGDSVPNGYGTVRLGTTTPGTAPLLPFDLLSASSARAAMSITDRKLVQLASQLGTIGSFQSRISVAITTLSGTVENYAAASGRIMDADIAQESANLVREGILQQAAAGVLAQANQAPALALTILNR